MTQASNALAAARKEVYFKRLDYAFVEYIIAQELLLNKLQTNKDFSQLKTHHSWEMRYDQCLLVRRTARSTIVKYRLRPETDLAQRIFRN